MRPAFLLAALLALPALAGAQSREQDIEALLEAVQWERQVEASNRVMRAAFIQGMKKRNAGKNPELARLVEQEYDAAFPVSAVIEQLKPRVVKLYADRFSSGEIRELTAIYRAPVFVKHRRMSGDLGRLIVAATQEHIRAGLGDLMKRVTDRAMSQKGGK